MSSDANVIWRKGMGDMPANAKSVVEEAQAELLLKALQLPTEVADLIRYNADKNSQTVNDYISTVLVGYLKSAS